MDGKSKLDELLVAYLLNELDADDQLLVEKWIAFSPENRQYLEELKRTLDIVHISHLAQDINVNEEWNAFQQALAEKEQKVAFGSSAEAVGTGMIREMNFRRKTSIYKTIAIIGVAASVILAIGLGWSLLLTKNTNSEVVAASKAEPVNLHAPEFKFLANKGSETELYTLEDGTEVLLAPNSTLSFRNPFEPNSRSVYLKGKAEFDVAHNKLKPFTVFSGNISTTALGTRFVVTAYNNGTKITVRLYEGKVLIKELIKSGSKKDYYLVPGQELTHYKPKVATTIASFRVPVAPAFGTDDQPENTAAVDQPEIPKYGKGSWYMFNNQSLSNVFDQLADMYNVKIDYVEKDLSKMYFIGTFNKEDSLISVLEQIGKLNKLEILRTNNKYLIRKK